MKSRKSIAVALLSALSLSANAQIMRIEMMDGKTMEIPVSSVTSISWYSNEPEETNPTTPDVSPSGVRAVDLGLPSGIKWANMNIGAESPEDYGYYYAWGETEPKAEYNWNNYFDSVNGSSSNFEKYATNKKTVLDPEDDVAHVKWGGDWRMPTYDELNELQTKCTWTLGAQNGVKGYTVVGPNGNSLFLPAAGYRYYSSSNSVGSSGHYWSSSLYSSYSIVAYYLYFGSSDVVYSDCSDRYFGRAVRPVCP